MYPAQERLIETIKNLELRDPQVPIIANATSIPLTTASAVKVELMSQLCTCVQWSKSVKTMANSGVSQFIEFGPGKVLTGLVKRISKGSTAVNVADLDSIEKATK